MDRLMSKIITRKLLSADVVDADNLLFPVETLKEMVNTFREDYILKNNAFGRVLTDGIGGVVPLPFQVETTHRVIDMMYDEGTKSVWVKIEFFNPLRNSLSADADLVNNIRLHGLEFFASPNGLYEFEELDNAVRKVLKYTLKAVNLILVPRNFRPHAH